MNKDEVIRIADMLDFIVELDRFVEPPSTNREPFIRLRYSKAEVSDPAHAVIIYQQDMDDNMFLKKLSKALIRYGKQKALNKLRKAVGLK